MVYFLLLLQAFLYMYKHIYILNINYSVCIKFSILFSWRTWWTPTLLLPLSPVALVLCVGLRPYKLFLNHILSSRGFWCLYISSRFVSIMCPLKYQQWESGLIMPQHYRNIHSHTHKQKNLEECWLDLGDIKKKGNKVFKMQHSIFFLIQIPKFVFRSHLSINMC